MIFFFKFRRIFHSQNFIYFSWKSYFYFQPRYFYSRLYFRPMHQWRVIRQNPQKMIENYYENYVKDLYLRVVHEIAVHFPLQNTCKWSPIEILILYFLSTRKCAKTSRKLGFKNEFFFDVKEFFSWILISKIAV